MAGVEWQSLRDEFTSAAALADDQSHLLSGKSRWGDYLHCYWRHFHPLFPILHYPATISAPPPALALLMVMIGAQFSALPESKIHSIAMHDSCAKLFLIVSLGMKNEGEFGAYTCISKARSQHGLAFRICRRSFCWKPSTGIGHGKRGSRVFRCLLNFGFCTPA